MQLVLDDVRRGAAKRASESHPGKHETDPLGLGELRVPRAEIVGQPGQQTGLFVTTSSEKQTRTKEVTTHLSRSQEPTRAAWQQKTDGEYE